MGSYRLGIDLGGTKVEGVVLEESEEFVERFRQRHPTEREHGYEHILGRIASLYREMETFIDGAPHTLGIGTPGAISPLTGLMKNCNTTCLNGKPLPEDLERLIQRPVKIHNDANCFALAEATLGAGVGRSWVFGVIMGTGCGGGLVVDGQVHIGPQAIAGEWGHMVIDPKGPDCYCGQRGCVETLISGGGLERRFAEVSDEPLTVEQIYARVHDGNSLAASVWERFLDDFGQAIANLLTVLDPDIVVLGGGLSNIKELYSDGVERIRAKIFSDSLKTPVVPHRLGDSAGVLGAALGGI